MEKYIAHGDEYLLKFKINQAKLFEECCIIDAAEIAGKHFKFLSAYQETQIGANKAVKMAEKYDILDSPDFLFGLAHSDFSDFQLLSIWSLARLIRFSVQTKNNKLFEKILDYSQDDLIVSCCFENITEWHKNIFRKKKIIG